MEYLYKRGCLSDPYVLGFSVGFHFTHAKIKIWYKTINGVTYDEVSMLVMV